MNPRTALYSLLLSLAMLPASVLAADSWAGRKLNSVLDELRSEGLPLLYSSQLVGDDLLIAKEPTAILQLDRLRMALAELGLQLQALEPPTQGYAIVRGPRPRTETRAENQSRAAATDNTSNLLEEIVVSSSRYNLTRANDVNSTDLPHASLEKTAGIEQDVLRSVQYLPGTSSNSVSTLTHVRGGYEDENLVRFDGVELYKPVHLKEFQGLFGLVDPDWVQSLNFYSGAYPVRYGNHNSAVIDIEPRSTAEPTLTVGTSMLYSRLFSNGSYDNENGHWLLGYRISNVATVMRHTEKNIGEPEFEDFLVRNAYALGNGELRMGVLRLNDDLQLQTDSGDQQARAHDHDIYFWLGWKQAVNEQLNYDLQLTHTQLSSQRIASLQDNNISSGALSDERKAHLYTLDGQINLHSGANTQWQWGIHINHAETRYAYDSFANYDAPLSLTFGKPATQQLSYRQSFEKPDLASYLSVTQQYGRWLADVGLRYDTFPYLNQGTQFSPRFNLQYATRNNGTIHLSAGHYVQAQNLYMLDSGAATPRFYAPQRMQQYIFGWSRNLADDLQLRVEGYQKFGSRLMPHNENLLSFITLASELEIDRNTVAPTRSRARGMEVSLTASTAQNFGWWLNYSWSRVQDQLNGQYVRRSWDQPNTVTAGANWTHAHWLLSGSATWHSGWAYTPLLVSQDGSSATLGNRNSQRFADFASLEMRIQYSRPIRAAELQVFLELRNALDHRNECCREALVDDSSGGPQISVNNSSALDLIPIAGISLKF